MFDFIAGAWFGRVSDADQHDGTRMVTAVACGSKGGGLREDQLPAGYRRLLRQAVPRRRLMLSSRSRLNL